jgi:hypothetical protein
MTPTPAFPVARRWLRWCVWACTLFLCCARFLYLNADFPNYSPWGIDQAKYTDEGWWASGAVMHHLLGHWNMPGDYNPAVAVPVWPILLGFLFKFTGVNIYAARALTVVVSLATLSIVFFLVCRYSNRRSATLAILLLAASPFAYVFSRLAILETLVIFQFCLLLLAASYAAERRLVSTLALAVLVPTLLLTKTTGVVLLPSAAWVLWSALRATPRTFVARAPLIGASSLAVLKLYFAIVAQRGFAPDLQYFFAFNQPEDIVWTRSLVVIAAIVRDGRWIDPVLYPLGLVLMLFACVRLRRLWRNPLFAASWIAIGCQLIFIFSRQEDYPPRYFLVMLVPIVISVVLAIDALAASYKIIYLAASAVIGISLFINIADILSIIRHRTFQLYEAATSIEYIVRQEPDNNHLLLGVSASQISLMTGLRSINDAYGTEPLAAKVLEYKPGWLLVWTGIGDEDKAALLPFRVEKVSSYSVFDEQDRGLLILYRVTDPAK